MSQSQEIVFTPEMDEVVRRLASLSMECSVAELGISRSVIAKRRRKLGLISDLKPGIDWTEIDPHLRAMAAKKIRVADQADQLGISVGAIGSRRRELGLMKVGNVWNEADSKRAAEMHGAGRSFEEIGRDLGYAATTVTRHLIIDGVISIPDPAGDELKPIKSHVEFGDFLIAKKAVARDIYGVAFPVPVSVSAGVERRF